MAHDPSLSPRAVLRRYQQDVWNDGRTECIPEIVSDPYQRHYPGKIEVVNNAELAERVRFYRRGLSQVTFHSVLEVAEGEYVTTAWETLGTTRKGQRLCTSGIEIFRVVAGRITDVWNGHAQDGQWAWNLKWGRPVRPEDYLDVQERVRDWGTQIAAP